MKQIKNFTRVLINDFKRAYISKNFIFAFLGIMIINLIDLKDEIAIEPAITVCYLFNVKDVVGGFSMVMLFLTVVPYGASFCIDFVSQNYKFQLIRTHINSYGLGKVIATFCSTVSVCIIGYILVAIFLGTLVPFFPNNEIAVSVAYGSSGTKEFLQILDSRYKFIYFIILILPESLLYGFLAVFALYISTLSSNKFVIYSSPIILYYSWSSIYNWLNLPKFLGWHLFDGILFDNKGIGINILCTVIYYIVLTFIPTVGFLKGLKRRVANG